VTCSPVIALKVRTLETLVSRCFLFFWSIVYKGKQRERPLRIRAEPVPGVVGDTGPRGRQAPPTLGFLAKIPGQNLKKTGPGVKKKSFSGEGPSSCARILPKHYKHLIKFITFVYALGTRDTQ